MHSGLAQQSVETFRRTSEGWTAYHAYGLGDEAELVSIGVRFAVAALYRRTEVAEDTDGPEGAV
jgi:hypothetical protein